MDQDEASKAERGIELQWAVAEGGATTVWRTLNRAHSYPTGHGVFLAVWLSAVGSSVLAARLFSTACYAVLLMVLWLTGRELWPERQPLFLLFLPAFLLADTLHGVHAGMSMLELPAILAAMAALLFHARYQRTGNGLVGAALLAALTFLIKYNFGIAVVSALIGAEVMNTVGAWGTGRYKRSLRALLTVSGITVVIIGGGLFVLGQWPWLVNYSTLQKEEAMFSAANLLYYFRFLADQGTTTIVASLLAFVLVAFGLIGRRPTQKYAAYILFFVLGLAIIIRTQENSPRFGMIILPPLWVAAVGGLDALLSGLGRKRDRLAMVGVVAAFVFGGILVNHGSLEQAYESTYENTNDAVHRSYEFVARYVEIPDGAHTFVAMLGRSDQWQGSGLHFHLKSQCLESEKHCDVFVADGSVFCSGIPRVRGRSQEEQHERMERGLATADYFVLYSNRRTFRYPGWQTRIPDVRIHPLQSPAVRRHRARSPRAEATET